MRPSFLHVTRDRWANLHPFVRGITILLLLCLAGIFVVAPGYRALKAWRLEQNLGNAQKAADAGNMGMARDLSLTVLQTGDPRIEAFRILEQSMATLRDPRHVEVARALMGHPSSSDQDRLNGFIGIARTAPLGIVAQGWASLPENCKNDPEFISAFADRLIADKRLSDAASLLVSLQTDSPPLAIRQRMIRVLIESGSAGALEEAQRRIADEWPDDPAGHAPWIEILESIPIASLRPDLLGAVRRALARNDDSAEGSLMLVRMDFSNRFSSRETIVDEAIRRWKTGAPEALARFLSDLGLHQRLLEVFAHQPDPGGGALRYRLEAAGKTARWQDLMDLLDSHGDSLNRFELSGRRAIAAAKLGNEALRTQAWAEALREASSSPRTDASLVLHSLAVEAGLVPEAEKALTQAIHSGKGPLPLFPSLVPLLESLARQNRENDIIRIYAIYLPFEPSNPVLLAQYAYLACLNELATPETLLKAVAPLAEAFPDIVPIQCILASIHLAGGWHPEAAATLDRQTIDPEKLAPGYRAVYEITRVLNLRIPADHPAVAGLRWESMLPSEKRRFARLLKQPSESRASGIK